MIKFGLVIENTIYGYYRTYEECLYFARRFNEVLDMHTYIYTVNDDLLLEECIAQF